MIIAAEKGIAASNKNLSNSHVLHMKENLRKNNLILPCSSCSSSRLQEGSLLLFPNRDISATAEIEAQHKEFSLIHKSEGSKRVNNYPWCRKDTSFHLGKLLTYLYPKLFGIGIIVVGIMLNSLCNNNHWSKIMSR